MVKLIGKIKTTSGKYHSWWESDIGIIRKPNSYKQKAQEIEPKVVEVKEETIMEAKKVLWLLPADALWARIVRRGVVIGVLTGVAVWLKNFMGLAPAEWQWLVPIAAAVLAVIDKWVREI